MDISNYEKRFWAFYDAHQIKRSQKVSLIAGQNVFSQQVASILASDLGNRIVETYDGDQLFPTMENYLEIELLLTEIVKSQLNCDSVEIRPLSGTSANFIIYRSLMKFGDSAASVSIGNGAHVSWSARTLNSLGFKHISLPYDTNTCTIHRNRSIEILLREKPRLVILGGSVVLFEDPIADIADIVHSYGGKVLYDAAHIIGHILSGHMFNPLEYGCDLLTFTLCKTIPGPQHAIICGNKDTMISVRDTAQMWHSGYHLHEVAASALGLIQYLQRSPNNSQQMIRNAQTLASELSMRGMNILKRNDDTATQTYMFIADVANFGGGKICEELLSKAGILVNRNLLPGQTGQRPSDPAGLRYGVAEVTNLGMKETEMKFLAEVISSSILSKKPERFISDVALLSSKFSQ